MKAGDQVWYADGQQEIVIACVDEDTGQLCASTPNEQWIPIACVVLQRDASFADHRAALTSWARTAGRRGEVARRQLGALWSDGKLAKGAVET